MDKRNNIGRTVNHDIKKRLTIGTPPHNRYSLALLDNSTVELAGVKYKVVGSSMIKGTMTDEFFLKKIYWQITFKGNNMQAMSALDIATVKIKILERDAQMREIKMVALRCRLKEALHENKLLKGNNNED